MEKIIMKWNPFKWKHKLLFLTTITLTSSWALAACTNGTTFANFNRFGVGIPNSMRNLKKYMEFIPNQEAIAKTPASVVMNSINNARKQDQMYFLKSFLVLKNDVLPADFSFNVKVSLVANEANALNFTINGVQINDGSRYSQTIKVGGFARQPSLSETDYQKLVNNILRVNGLDFLASDKDLVSPSSNAIKARYIRDASTIMSKYLENTFPNNPLANMYYAGNFNAGGNKATSLIGKTQENEAKELRALNAAREIIAKKEIQSTRNLETGQVIDPGYSDAPRVRNVVQKLLNLAVAYRIQDSSNTWKDSAQLKKVISDVLDDFAKNYYYPGQQQYVNWWFYEIGIPRDLMNLLVVLNPIYSKTQLKTWSAAIDYFVPNPRYGGSSKTAINGFEPVLDRRLQTGANVIDNSRPIIMSGILNHNANKVQDSLLAMYDNLFRAFVDAKDGFYYDGSFIQHDNLAYIGSYGEVLLTGMANIFGYLTNTPLSIETDSRFERLYQFIELAVMPFMYKGSIGSGLSGRSIVRAGYAGRQKGFNILSSLSVFAEHAPAKYRARLHNFIVDQLQDYSADQIKQLAPKFKISAFLTQNLFRYVNGTRMGQDARSNQDWHNYQTNYFNKYFEPTVVNPLGLNAPSIPVGIDLAAANNNLVFTKNQDRYSYKTKDFMLNINLHGRKTGFAESLLGENEEAYYQTDGSTLIYTKNNPDPYADEYWTTVDPELIPGTSSIKFDGYKPIYDYQYPTNLGSNTAKWPKQEQEKYKKFMAALAKKNDVIEKQISLSTNNSYNNGIIFNQTGFVKASVINYDQSLVTNKAYFMIDDQIIVVGNVSKQNQAVRTTIANHMYSGEQNQSNQQSFKQENWSINSHSKKFFHFENNTNSDQNGYVILSDTPAASQTLNASKYPIIANFNRNALIEGKISRKFDWLGFNHQNNKQFAYSIIPAYDSTKKSRYIQTLQNFSIIRNDGNYIIAKYKSFTNQGNGTNYYIGSYFFNPKGQSASITDGPPWYTDLVKKGVDVPDLKLKLFFNQPTTLVLRNYQNFQDLDGVASFDLNPSIASFGLNQQFNYINSRLITNPEFEWPIIKDRNEVKLESFNNQTNLTFNNQFYRDITYNHNMWFQLKNQLKTQSEK